MKIFVVIVTYNGASWIKLALESLQASTAKCTVIVVDNASIDETKKIINDSYKDVILIPQEKNTGFGIGNNIGISYAIKSGAEFIFLLNQDAFVTHDTIGQLSDFLKNHSEFGVVTPLHCSPNLSMLDQRTQNRYLQGYAPNYLSDACLGITKKFYEIHGINAAAWMVRKQAFMTAGGFDPLFFMYGEDDDLITRFNNFGQKFALLPSSRIVHLRAKSPRIKSNLFKELWGLSERARSELLLDAKLPTGKIGGKIIRLLVNGIGRPFLQLIIERDLKRAVSYYIACFRIFFEFNKIQISRKRCAKEGPHYLQI